MIGPRAGAAHRWQAVAAATLWRRSNRTFDPRQHRTKRRLLIGVHDSGLIEGLDADLATFGGVRDKFEVHLTNVIKQRFSESFRAGCVSVSYPTEDGKTICRVDVQRSRSPVYLSLAYGGGPEAERLIVRAGASSQEIPLSQVADYVREHFRT
ncbi:MAG TPA: hypothetical protein VHX64_10720 [Caulobacteraceae bacterium]|nr:hypothetical protein [Caulobacteraceae bacterium]